MLRGEKKNTEKIIADLAAAKQLLLSSLILSFHNFLPLVVCNKIPLYCSIFTKYLCAVKPK